MSYTALARKWRPKKFAELVGQEHVRRALVNALASGRVHHAFLFTGTRGVGKTTIARILAKCLNCELGVTPEPDGSSVLKRGPTVPPKSTEPNEFEVPRVVAAVMTPTL